MRIHGVLPSAMLLTLVDVCPGCRGIDMLNPGGYDWSSASSIQGDADKDQCLSLVRHAVARMHRNGYVHGDLRAANVLCGKTQNDASITKVLLVDFDASGAEGTARYPFLPFTIPYAPDALPGGLVSLSHDLWRLETTDRFYS